MTRNNLEKQMLRTKKLAEEKGISEDELEKMYQEKLNSFDESLNLTDHQKSIRAFKLIRGELRSDKKSESINGMLLCRFRDNTYNKYMYDQVQEYIDKNGLEAAQDAQMVNPEGKYLFTSGFNKGSVIDPENISGSAIGIFQDQDGNPKPRFVKIGKFQVKEKIPLGSDIKMFYKESTKSTDFGEKDLFYNGSETLEENQFYSEEALEKYAQMIQDLLHTKVFENYDNMIDYAANVTNDRNNVIGIWTDVLEVGDSINNVPITFEFEDACVKYWCDRNIFNGLTIPEGGFGIVLLNAYNGKEGIGFNVIGFLPSADE